MNDRFFPRRTFLKTTGLGVAAPALAETAGPGTERITEPAREIPVVEDADVIVAGAGPAGVSAALAAARRGARTVLIETHGCLGGVWTAGSLCWILDHGNKRGIMAELKDELGMRAARPANKQGEFGNAFDPEVMKVMLEELCLEDGVRVHLHTRVVAARRDGRRLTHLITESKSGRQAMKGRVFVDCSGDGDLAAQAGCAFEIGHPETGATQPFSMLCMLTGIDAEEIREFYREPGEPWAPPKQRLKAAMEKGGHSPSYASPSLFRVRDDLFLLMANHEYGVSAIDEPQVTEATMRARAEYHRMIDGLRNLGGPWRGIHIVATSEQIGTREGRRILGRYTVTQEDLREGKRHEDAVCRVTFPIDVHATDPSKGKSIEARPFRSQPYDIPLRALIAKDVDGLMMAGRCISGDFIAHSSYRVTGNAVGLGEAAGTTAAVAATSKRSVQDIRIDEIRRR